MPHHAALSRAKLRSRNFGRALVEAGVVLSLTLAILAVLFAGMDRAAAAGLDGMAFDATNLDAGRATVGAVLLALFGGMCVLTTFMMRNTVNNADRASVKALARRASAGRGSRLG